LKEKRNSKKGRGRRGEQPPIASRTTSPERQQKQYSKVANTLKYGTASNSKKPKNIEESPRWSWLVRGKGKRFGIKEIKGKTKQGKTYMKKVSHGTSDPEASGSACRRSTKGC